VGVAGSTSASEAEAEAEERVGVVDTDGVLTTGVADGVAYGPNAV
jgi:hypothetical protein